MTTREAIHRLISSVNNENQRTRLERCVAGEMNKDNEFYLVNWDDQENVATLLGTKNPRGTRSEYRVKIEDEKIVCNCPDYYNACQKYGLLCKHVCFIVTRVAKRYDVDYFNDHVLSDEMRESVLKALSDRNVVALFTAKESVSPEVSNLQSAFTPSPEELQEVCPICYDDTTTLDGLVKCPTCRQTMHCACIKVWLTKAHTCVLCRSDVWKEFKG